MTCTFLTVGMYPPSGASLTTGIATLRPGVSVRRRVFPKGLSQRFSAAMDVTPSEAVGAGTCVQLMYQRP